ncbi:MAG: hypothetical protein WCT46_02215 [Candidatus Gracilibacteria bacterium]
MPAVEALTDEPAVEVALKTRERELFDDDLFLETRLVLATKAMGGVDMSSFLDEAIARRTVSVSRDKPWPSWGGKVLPADMPGYSSCSEGLPRDVLPFKELPNIRIGRPTSHGFGHDVARGQAYLRGIPMACPVHNVLNFPGWWHYWQYDDSLAYSETRPSNRLGAYSDQAFEVYNKAHPRKKRVWPELPKRPDPRRKGSIENDGGKLRVRLGIRRGLAPDNDDIAVAIENGGSGESRFSRAVWYDLVAPYLSQHDVPEGDPVSWSAKRLQILWGMGYHACLFVGAEPWELEDVICEMAHRTFNADSSDLAEPREFEYGKDERVYIDGVKTRLGRALSPELTVFLLENREAICVGKELQENEPDCIVPSKDVFPFLRAFDTFVENGLHVDRLSAFYRAFCAKGVTRPLNKALCIVYYIYSGKVEVDCGKGKMPYSAGEQKPWWFRENFDLVKEFFDEDVDGVSVVGNELKVGVCDQGIDLIINLASCGRFATPETVRLYKSASPSFLRRVGEDPTDGFSRHADATASFAGRVARSFAIGNEDRGSAIFALAESMVPFDRGAELLDGLWSFIEKQKPESFVGARLRGSDHGINFPGMAEYLTSVGGENGCSDPSVAGFFGALGPLYFRGYHRSSVPCREAMDSCDNPRPRLLSLRSTSVVPADSRLDLSPLEMLEIYELMAKRVGDSNADMVLRVFYGSLARDCHPLMEGLPEAISRILESGESSFKGSYSRFASSRSWGASYSDPDRKAGECAFIVKHVFGSLLSAARGGIVTSQEVEKIMRIVSYSRAGKDPNSRWLDENEDAACRMMGRLEQFGSRYKLMSELEAVGAVSSDQLKMSCRGHLKTGKFEKYQIDRSDHDVLRIDKRFLEHLVALCRLKVVATPFQDGVVDTLLSDGKALKLARSEWRGLPEGDVDYAPIFAGCSGVVFDGTEESVQRILDVLDSRKEEFGCIWELTNPNSGGGDRTHSLMGFYKSGSPKFGAVLSAIGPKYSSHIAGVLAYMHLAPMCSKDDFSGVEAFAAALPEGCSLSPAMVVRALADHLSGYNSRLIEDFLFGADKFNFNECIAMFGKFGISREAFLLPFCQHILAAASNSVFPDNFAREFSQGKVDLGVSLHRLNTFHIDLKPFADAISSNEQVMTAFLFGKFDLEACSDVFAVYGISKAEFDACVKSRAMVAVADKGFYSRFAGGFVKGEVDLSVSLSRTRSLGLDISPFVGAITNDYHIASAYLFYGKFDYTHCISVFESFGVPRDNFLGRLRKTIVSIVTGLQSNFDLSRRCLDGDFLQNSLGRLVAVGGDPKSFVDAIAGNNSIASQFLLGGKFDFGHCISVFESFGIPRTVFTTRLNRNLVATLSSIKFNSDFVNGCLNGSVDLDFSLQRVATIGSDPKALLQGLSVAIDPIRFVALAANGGQGALFVQAYFSAMNRYGFDTSELRRKMPATLATFMFTGGGSHSLVHGGGISLSTSDSGQNARISAGILANVASSVFAARRMICSGRDGLIVPAISGGGVDALVTALVDPRLSLERVGFQGDLLSVSGLSSLVEEFYQDRESHVPLLLDAIRQKRVQSVGLLSVAMKLHLYKGHKFSPEFVHRVSCMPGFSNSGGFKLDNDDSCLVCNPFPSAGELKVILQWLGLLELLSSEERNAEFQLTGPYELDNMHAGYLVTSLLLATKRYLPINAHSFSTAGYNSSLGRIALQSGGAHAFRFPFQTFSSESPADRTDVISNIDIDNVDIFQLVHTLMVHHQKDGPLRGVARWFMNGMKGLLHSYKGVDVTTLGSSVEGLDSLDKRALFAKMKKMQSACGGGADFILDGPWIGGDLQNVEAFAHHMICVGVCTAVYAQGDDLFNRINDILDIAKEKIKPYQAGLLVGAGYRYEAGEFMVFVDSPDSEVRELFRLGCSSPDVEEVKALLNIK